MTSTLAPPASRTPVASALDRDVAMRLAGMEYDRVADTFEQLSTQQWTLPTDCPGWDVRAMAGHLVGMAEMATGLRETIRQQAIASWRARRDGVEVIDAQTALQVREHAGLSVSTLVARMRELAPRAVAGRRSAPGLIRRMSTPPQLVGTARERWTVGYLLDTILTRDPFMHRLDIARATGVLIPSTREHEGVIVDDVVREWAGRHGGAYTLELTGPAGGRWESGAGGESIRVDALDFCRAVSGRAVSGRGVSGRGVSGRGVSGRGVSGRGAATGLLATPVPF